MPQIKFAPISRETPIPGTNCTIQIGVIQNHDRTWGVKLTQSGRVIAAKRIKKLIDVEIVGIIRDTIGKQVALDTFELGTTMSNLLRETYEKIQSKQQKPPPQPAPAPKPTSTPPPRPPPTPTQQPASVPARRPTHAPAPQPTVTQPAPEKPSEVESALTDMKIPDDTSVAGQGDSFWSAYSHITTPQEPNVEPQPTIQQPSQPAPAVTPPAAPQVTASSDRLEDAFAILGVKCPNCGNDVDSDEDNCPYCRQSL